MKDTVVVLLHVVAAWRAVACFGAAPTIVLAVSETLVSVEVVVVVVLLVEVEVVVVVVVVAPATLWVSVAVSTRLKVVVQGGVGTLLTFPLKPEP